MKKYIKYIILFIVILLICLNEVRIYFIKKDKNIDKIETAGEYVYDYKHNLKFDKDHYETKDDKVYFSKDIKVPFINIESKYARNVNDEIKELIRKVNKTYNEGVKDNKSFSTCTYELYQNDDMVSIIIINEDNEGVSYYTYNISLKTGEKLSYKEVYELLDFDEDNVDISFKESLQESVKGSNLNLVEMLKVISGAISKYRQDLKNGKVKYFVNKEGNLSIITEVNGNVKILSMKKSNE